MKLEEVKEKDHLNTELDILKDEAEIKAVKIEVEYESSAGMNCSYTGSWKYPEHEDIEVDPDEG